MLLTDSFPFNEVFSAGELQPVKNWAKWKLRKASRHFLLIISKKQKKKSVKDKKKYFENGRRGGKFGSDLKIQIYNKN